MPMPTVRSTSSVGPAGWPTWTIWWRRSAPSASTSRSRRLGTRCDLDPSVDLAAYRVIQEALTNVNKHAGAGAVARVQLSWRPSELVIEVVDDGQVNAGIEHLASGYGLVGLAERVKLVGGRLESGPAPRGGFRVYAVLPTSGFDWPSPVAGSRANRSRTT